MILSNVDHRSFAGKAHLGIDFDFVFTAEDIGSYKPDPRSFQFLHDRLDDEGIAKEQILHTAQSLFHDYLPASKFGLETCWIDRRHHLPGWGATPEPAEVVRTTYRFESLARLADVVEADT